MSPKTLKEMRSAFEVYVFPSLGKNAVDKISYKNCVAIQKALQDKGIFSTADKIRSWLTRTSGYTIASGVAENNPTSYFIDVSVKRPKSENFPYLLEDELPDFLKTLRASKLSTAITLSRCMASYLYGFSQTWLGGLNGQNLILKTKHEPYQPKK